MFSPAGIRAAGFLPVPVSAMPGDPPALTGPVTVCEGSTGNFYSTDPGQTGYIWTLSEGGIIAGGDGTFTISVNWQPGSFGARWVSVSYNGSPVTTTLDVNVLPLVPASVTIAPSQGTVCSGAPVTFTATPVSGGATPVYQWHVNGFPIAGASSSTYTYTPANGDIVSCNMNSSETCPSASPAVSNQVIMAVQPILPATILVTASSNPACTGVPVTFSTTVFNGGSGPGYQWRVNGTAIEGATENTYTCAPSNGEKYTCVLTSNASCVSSNPATSNEVNMVVNQFLPVSVSIAPVSPVVCTGNQAVLNATPANGGTAPVFQWFVNGTLSGTNSPQFVYTPENGDAITCILTSNSACATGNPANSNTVNLSVGAFYPASVTIAASANPACNGMQVTYTATSVNGGTAPVYYWFVGSTTMAIGGPVFLHTPNQGEVITCVLHSNASCVTGNPATSNAITMTISPAGAPSVSISTPNNPSCQGTMVTLTAVPQNGGTTPSFQWKVNGQPVGANSSVFAYTPANNDQVTCTMTSGSLCSNGVQVVSNVIGLVVSPIKPVGVSISAPPGPVCQGNSVTYTAVPVNGGTNPVYQWKVDGANVGTNSSSYTYQPNDGQVVTCVLTSNVGCSIGNPAQSNPLVMSVSASLPAAVTIAASANPGCAGMPVIFTATPVNGGSAPQYQWKINGANVPGATNAVYTHTAAGNYSISCTMASNNGCPPGNNASSNEIQVTINPQVTASLSILASANPSCQGIFVTYTATPLNGGPDPSFQWYVGAVPAGINSPTFQYSPNQGDVVKCVMTSSDPCAAAAVVTSNLITMTVNPIATPSITVVPSGNPVCPGTSVTFTAVVNNGGASPSYQWYHNNNPTGGNFPIVNLIPNNNDVIKCRLTTSNTCVTGNQAMSPDLVMGTSSPLPGQITISGSENPFCEGNTVNFSSSIVNGGPTPVYQWKKNGINVGTGPSYSYAPVDGDFITCVMTSSLSCATGPVTSNPILMLSKKHLPVSVSVSASQNPVCPGSQVTLTATPLNGGSAPAYQWKVNDFEVPGATAATYTYVPANGDQVTCRLTSNASCSSGNPAWSLPLTVSTNAGVPVSITIATKTNPFCEGTSVTYTATPFNGGTAPQYTWKVNGAATGGDTPSFTFFPAGGDIVTCELLSNATCNAGSPVAVSPPVVMTSETSLPVSVTIQASANPACQGASISFSSEVINGGENPLYQWFKNGTLILGATAPSYSYVPVEGNRMTCRVTSDLSCATGNPAISNEIVMSVSPTVFPSVTIAASANQVCEGTTVTFTATVINGGSSPAYTWRVNGLIISGATSSVFSYNPQNYDAVACQVSSTTDCNSGIPVISNQLAMTVFSEQTVGIGISTESLSFCEGSEV